MDHLDLSTLKLNLLGKALSKQPVLISLIKEDRSGLRNLRSDKNISTIFVSKAIKFNIMAPPDSMSFHNREFLSIIILLMLKTMAVKNELLIFENFSVTFV
ncbi:hypothetical protein WUBG_09166 [Wuchereria bancrofti]|uniref:Uncharacterized protein n=1 Tax=Wuchereria bancrofti TaxID=6293 RepID=J9AZ80_WUCBA|nr:hypothetical protein WUBG_09166 [Wuchereria bancrofti]